MKQSERLQAIQLASRAIHNLREELSVEQRVWLLEKLKN